jgi:hypothetical protein
VPLTVVRMVTAALNLAASSGAALSGAATGDKDPPPGPALPQAEVGAVISRPGKTPEVALPLTRPDCQDIGQPHPGRGRVKKGLFVSFGPDGVSFVRSIQPAGPFARVAWNQAPVGRPCHDGRRRRNRCSNLLLLWAEIPVAHVVQPRCGLGVQPDPCWRHRGLLCTLRPLTAAAHWLRRVRNRMAVCSA